MPEPIGKIIRINNKFPGGPPTLAVNTIGEGLRKHLNMCFCCARFQPNSPDHCQIAEELLAFGKQHAIATLLVRCATFEPHESGQVTDGSGKAQVL